jgi:formylglycine-generating enzyme required for sulfatase activity
MRKQMDVGSGFTFLAHHSLSRKQFMKWLLAILILAVVGCSAESDITTDFDVTNDFDVTTEGDVTTNSIGMKLKLIPAGTFMMGSEDTQEVHQVTLTKPFLLGVYEVTQRQYERVMGVNPSEFKGLFGKKPVEWVSWEDAVEFCRKLSTLPSERAAGRVYRLPTEAEWEYACRAGTTTTFSFGDDRSQVGDYAWFGENSEETTHPVGEKKPNAWGLYDMHGNVFEWCSDWHGDYPSDAVTDPTGAPTGEFRVIRGGCWKLGAGTCRSASRVRRFPSKRDYHYGFRVACVPSGTTSAEVAASPPMDDKEADGPEAAIAPFDADEAKKYQEAWAEHLGLNAEITNSIGMKLRVIPAGTFLMGSEYAKPIHRVTLTQPFLLGVYEVTQEQYEKVMGGNPSFFQGSQNPVELLTWEEAVAFCKKLSSLPSERAAGRFYRLPTEAEWEYACRAGTTESKRFANFGWGRNNSGRKTHPVGERLANPWGLYDMLGNVREWCSDWGGDYPSVNTTDPTGAHRGSNRVIRGGSWGTYFRPPASRDWDGPYRSYDDLGFRVACVPSGQ